MGQLFELINLPLWKIEYPDDLRPTLGLSYRTALLLDPGKANAAPRRGETLFRAAFRTITLTFPPCVDRSFK
jgi:hypothetical protein